MFLRLFSVCFLCIFSLQGYDVAVTAIFRDEERFLKEWIEYHLLIGVDHFYLTNHRSKDDSEKILEPYIRQGIVDLRYENRDSNRPKAWNSIQMFAYRWGLEKARNEAKWLIVIDTDEFVVPKNGETLNGILKAREKESAIAVNWQIFGTSHVFRIPDRKLLIETLLLKAPRDYKENEFFKLIVQPNKVDGFIGPHQCALRSGAKIVDMAGHIVPEVQVGGRAPFQFNLTQSVEVDTMQINHYWTRDEDFLTNVKIPRGKKMGGWLSSIYKRAEQLNQEPDDAILPFIAPLRTKMGFVD